jgi:uncharacterized protein (DUF2249 family)
MTTTFVEFDVRPTLRAGGEPFEQIMDAVNALKPNEGLRLFATFKPTPLLHVLGSKSFKLIYEPRWTPQMMSVEARQHLGEDEPGRGNVAAYRRST